VISGLIFVSSHAQVKPQEITHYLFPEFTQGIVLLFSSIGHPDWIS
jgi:hypothetical protein